jgi:hypothetical protein
MPLSEMTHDASLCILWTPRSISPTLFTLLLQNASRGLVKRAELVQQFIDQIVTFVVFELCFFVRIWPDLGVT